MFRTLALCGALATGLLAAPPASARYFGEDHAAAVALVFSTPASAQPGRASRVNTHRVRREIDPAVIDAQAEGHPLELHPLLAVASRYVNSGKFTGQPGPWCRDAINAWAREAGIHLANNSRRAIDALGLGRRVSTPEPGDLIVMRHHVTIFAGWGGRGVLGLGGNQGRRVRLSSYPARRVVAFVRL